MIFCYKHKYDYTQHCVWHIFNVHTLLLLITIKTYLDVRVTFFVFCTRCIFAYNCSSICTRFCFWIFFLLSVKKTDERAIRKKDVEVRRLEYKNNNIVLYVQGRSEVGLIRFLCPPPTPVKSLFNLYTYIYNDSSTFRYTNLWWLSESVVF